MSKTRIAVPSSLKPRAPKKTWAGPAYGSSQQTPPPPSTAEQRIPAFLRDVIGKPFGSYEGRDVRKTSFEWGVWTPRKGGGAR